MLGFNDLPELYVPGWHPVLSFYPDNGGGMQIGSKIIRWCLRGKNTRYVDFFTAAAMR